MTFSILIFELKIRNFDEVYAYLILQFAVIFETLVIYQTQLNYKNTKTHAI